jgi:hypothetical protein
MRHPIVAAIWLAASPALAQEATLAFDIQKLCTWQAANNGMDLAECSKLEEESKAAQAGLEAAAEPARKEECVKEAQNYSGDSGAASHTVYTECLKNGPGAL